MKRRSMKRRHPAGLQPPGWMFLSSSRHLLIPPLLRLDNFLAGMHVAGSTHEALERAEKAVADDVFAVLGIDR